ncbi:hypothetical protein Cpir12675_000077 [Ceratocystis pirilliformis]|uniref:Protein byr4 n=1 Tax=Ceratocystis pirilliformis TaxID=259994 RepID=A0ABR3ZPU8_9PEZI
MESLRLKQREPVVADADIENWDDDDFLLDDDISFHTTQSGRQSAGPAMPRSPSSTSNRRDSHSSHISFRSERESLNGEERHIFLPEDERSTLDAIKAAANLGIPLPQNIPPSALMGGSINRLGGRKGKKVSQDGWEVDLEFPESSQALSLKQQDSSKFPETLRQVSGSSLNSMVSDANSTPLKMPPDLDTSRSPRRSPVPSTRAEPAPINLDRFRDDDDDGFFGGDTIKVTKRQQRKPLSLITPATSFQNISSLAPAAAPPPTTADDDFEADLQLPSDCKLSLRKGRDIPGLAPHNDDLDWGDGSGSLGTRYGGTKREQRSARSSSASALSPSVASSMTVESEDDTFDGLVLPPGLLNLDDRLKGLGDRRKSNSPDPKLEEPTPYPWDSVQTPSTDHEDLLDGLEFGDGAIDARKITAHKNIKRKTSRDKIPPRIKTTASITFSNSKNLGHQQPQSQSRLPRLSHGHGGSHLSLEPVSESGGPIQQRANRLPASRVGHSAQSSVSSLATPTTPMSSTSSISSNTPRRRELINKNSNSNLREAYTTNAQLLRLKRSLPVMRGPQSAKPAGLNSSFNRPSSRSDLVTPNSSRPSSLIRPKTPAVAEISSSTGLRKPAPFIPPGVSSHSQSQNVAPKGPRVIRRHTSEVYLDSRPTSRNISRTGTRSPSPRRYRAHEKATLDSSWRQFNKPKTRHFGDGHELDAFDDLPTSATIEAKFVKAPVTSGPKAALRGKLYGNIQPEQRTTTPSPAPFTPTSSTSGSYTPRFARDTASSRIAREASLAQRAPSHGAPTMQYPTPRVAQLSNRSNFSPGLPSPVRSRKTSKKTQQKPHLITNMGNSREPKNQDGMCYNPDTYRWEGNDTALAAFEPPPAAPSPLAVTIPQMVVRDKETSTPRPALITNISATKGIQVVGGMVFDPQNMCWLKISQRQNQRGARSRHSNSNLHSAAGSQSDALDSIDGDQDSDEDPFKDIPDLMDNSADSGELTPGGGRVSDVKDEWMVGEEFDVGPEFVRRQREEEERWRKKCERWLAASSGRRDKESWRWTLRDLVVGDYH